MTLGMSLLGESLVARGRGMHRPLERKGVRRDTLAYYMQHVGWEPPPFKSQEELQYERTLW